MINLSISKTTDTNGATLYTLTPSPVVLGNQNANAVDEVQVAGIPAEWDGLTIRAVFVPTPGAAVACILDENGRCTVSSSFTGNRGEIVVDAFGEDYHAYTTPARYAVARHQDISATVDPEYTPTQVEQILAQAQTYANDAQEARDDAQGYAEDAAASAAEIEDMTVSAQTLPAGSAATVTKTETQTGINLDFGLPRGADGQVQDVQINGASIVEDGVADIPKATQNAWGLFKPYSGYGIAAIPQGAYVTKANNPQIDGRETNYCPIVPTNLDYAVKAALTDGVGTAYTDAEKAAARARIGAGIVDDVKVNNTSIVTNGVADIPNATLNDYGLFKPINNNGTCGLYISNNGTFVAKATETVINRRGNDYMPVVPSNLDYAVKAAMTDGRGAAWTAAEQLAGRERLGIGNYELIETITLTQTESPNAGNPIYRDKEPDNTPYNFSKMLVLYFLPATASTSIFIYTRFDNTDNNPNIWTTVAQAGGNFMAIGDASNGLLLQYATTNARTNGRDESPLEISQRVVPMNAITYWKMWKHGTDPLPIGTKIEIYGVRI